ncbi:MAG: alkaline phosphatase family protein, partial [Candidatus Bathyarchaeia archaeon]
TTDYVPHKHAPGTPEAERYMARLDEELARIAEHGVALGVVADHGMNEKRVNLDLVRLLAEEGRRARFIAAIKDEHVIHHQNLGGSAYLYVEGDVEGAREVVASADGVEVVLTRAEAAARFRLPADRIGDLLVLAEIGHTFGPNPRSVYADVEVRSHGSLHEREVPLILNRRLEAGRELYNKDVIPALMGPGSP